MPEVRFRVRWPDGTEEECYSPSTVIREHLGAPESYSVCDFLFRSRKGLEKAARRVEARYGYRCSSADAQAERIAAQAARFSPQEIVRCLSMS